MPASAADIARVFREESGRATAILIRHFGDIDVAEEAVQEAFVTATRHWADHGLPPHPGGWITTTAKRWAIDRLRREHKRDAKEGVATALLDIARDENDHPMHALPDDRLPLFFTCCHPALARPAQVALTLRLLGGLTTPEIARAFLVEEPTMAQRLVRAKKKIKQAGIPYRVPDIEELPARVEAVLGVVYLVFNEGHTASSGDDLVRHDLCDEGVRLARVLALLLPDEPEVLGLLALLLLIDARRDARRDPSGRLVLLADQDRARWDLSQVAEGHAIVRRCLSINRPGRYQLQAAIQAVHTDAADAASTDWHQIVQLYDQLLTVDAGPVVRLNRAVAVAERDGAQAGLDALAPLPLAHYAPYWVARAELCRRLDRPDEARAAYDEALARSENQVERAHLTRRRQSLPRPH